MLRLKYLANKFQKRTLRVEYNQHRATPYDGVLDSSIGTGAVFTKPTNAFVYKNGLVPGTVMVHNYKGDAFVVADSTANTAIQPFGLLGNFVAGDLDELGDEKTIGVWNGVGSTYTLLGPAFDDGTNSTSNVSNLATAAAAATAGTPVVLHATINGRLGVLTTPGNRVPVAQLLERVSAQVIRIRLLV